MLLQDLAGPVCLISMSCRVLKNIKKSSNFVIICSFFPCSCYPKRRAGPEALSGEIFIHFSQSFLSGSIKQINQLWVPVPHKKRLFSLFVK